MKGGAWKKEEKEDEGRGTRDEGECENNDNENENVRVCQKALYYNVLSACRVSNTTLFIGPKIKIFFVNLQLKMIANKVNLED